MHYSTKIPRLTRLLLVAAFCVIGLMSMSIKASDAHAQSNNQFPCVGIPSHWTYISSFTETLSAHGNAQFFTGVLAHINDVTHKGCGDYIAASAIKAPNGWRNGPLLTACFYTNGQPVSGTCATTSVNGTGEFWAVGSSIFISTPGFAAHGSLAGLGLTETVPFSLV